MFENLNLTQAQRDHLDCNTYAKSLKIHRKKPHQWKNAKLKNISTVGVLDYIFNNKDIRPLCKLGRHNETIDKLKASKLKQLIKLGFIISDDKDKYILTDIGHDVLREVRNIIEIDEVVSEERQRLLEVLGKILMHNMSILSKLNDHSCSEDDPYAYSIGKDFNPYKAIAYETRVLVRTYKVISDIALAQRIGFIQGIKTTLKKYEDSFLLP